MDKNLIEKIVAESDLSAEESLRLDEALEAKGSAAVARAVRELPDDAPSMAWRSDLNEKLGKASRKQRVLVTWRYGLAVTAGATAMFLFVNFGQPGPVEDPIVRKGTQIVESTSLEDDILSDHQNAMTQASMGVIVSFDESAGF
ncbi:MAG: hypothetical protein IH945_06805 [Armatimonadetes bacterium]|nr:hypothetical protein [Armatimonadota bacterium]